MMTNHPIPTVAELASVVALQLGVRQVDPAADLVEDLGVSSIDLISVLATIEDRWGIALDETVFATVSTLEQLAQRVTEAARSAPHRSPPLPAGPRSGPG